MFYLIVLFLGLVWNGFGLVLEFNVLVELALKNKSVDILRYKIFIFIIFFEKDPFQYIKNKFKYILLSKCLLSNC